MATTPNYGYVLPTVGGDFEIWGDYLNSNWSEIDTDLKATDDSIVEVETAITDINTDLSGRVAKVGDSMSGMLVLPATEPTNNNHATKKQYVDNGELSQASRYLFSTGITDANPGAGKIGCDNADAQLATRLYVSATCTNGKSSPGFVNFVDGVIIGLSRTDRTIYYRVTSAVDNATWYTLTVVSLDTGVAFSSTAADAAILLTFLGYLKPEIVVPPYTDHLITSWSLSDFEVVPHGLGTFPVDVRAIFKCKNPVHGYTVGAMLYLAVASNDERGGYSVSATATNVHFSTGDTIYLVPRGGATFTSIGTITPADWDVF